MRLALALLFFFVALSELVHLEPVLGAFMGGALLSFIFQEKVDLERKMSGIGNGFLIPLFFIHVGMEFDLRNILSPSQIVFTLKLLMFALAVKILPGLLFAFRCIPVMQCIHIGILLSSRLSLIIVASSIGLEAGFIDEPFKDAVVLLAIITCLSCPRAFKLLHRPGAEPAAQQPPGQDRKKAFWFGRMRQ